MGNSPVKIWKKKDRELRILMVGLDAAGKTTILYKLKRDVTFKTIPTVGFNVEQFEYKKYTISLWDLGGQDNLRYHWRHFYTGTQGLIFVVDSSDRDRLEDAREELNKVLNDREMRDCTSLLIYANKQDMNDAATKEEIIEELSLKTLTKHDWCVKPVCGHTGDGLKSGLDWLLEKAKSCEKTRRKTSKSLSKMSV